MNYYVVQVQTGNEESYIKNVQKSFNSLLTNIDIPSFYFPKRNLPIRKEGKTTMQLHSIFPGYIFLESTSITKEIYNTMRHVKGFYHFLNSNTDIVALTGKDLQILKHFLSFGTVINTSKVYFDENDKIVVKYGPLQGLEGQIIKVDKRKKRAKIQLDFANTEFTLDLAFEVIEKNKEA